MTDFLVNYVPSGLLGILLAATFAAAMSSIDSVLNSLTAVFTKDIYEPYISHKESTPLSKTITFSVIFGVIIVAFVYMGLGGNTKSILDIIGKYLSPFGSLITGLMFVCMFTARVNDNGAFFGSLAAAAITYGITSYYPMHWLWVYAVGTVICIICTYVCSLFFKDESAEKKKYTVFGVRDSLAGQKDEEGTVLAPLVMDKYGWIMLGIGIVQCLVLIMLQM